MFKKLRRLSRGYTSIGSNVEGEDRYSAFNVSGIISSIIEQSQKDGERLAERIGSLAEYRT